MKFLASILVVGMASAPSAQGPSLYKPAPRELKMIHAVQQTDVAKLDRLLPSETLKHWISRNIFDYKLGDWETNDCGEQTGSPKSTPASFPICVEFRGLYADGRQITIQIAVGDNVKGLTKQRQLWYVEFMKPSREVVPLKSLHELVPLIQTPAAYWHRRPQ